MAHSSGAGTATKVSSQKACLSPLDSLWEVCLGKSQTWVGGWRISGNCIWPWGRELISVRQCVRILSNSPKSKQDSGPRRETGGLDVYPKFLFAEFR